MTKRNLVDVDTGVLYENVVKIRTEEQNENYKKHMENKMPDIKTIAPFVRYSVSKYAKEKLSKLSPATRDRLLYGMFGRLDVFGRIKYGDNYEEYCRSFEDLMKIQELNINTIATLKKFRLELANADIIRFVSFSHGDYIVLNPGIVVNGKSITKAQYLAFKDIIIENFLLEDEEIIRMNILIEQDGWSLKI
ncbi:MAG: hypothetical protein ACRCZ9_10075 [Fusobacteriaceae bacterium]